MGILAVLGVLGFLGRKHLSGNAYTNLPPTSGTSWVAFGDSLTAGVGADQGKDYPSQLSDILGIPVLNQGVSGETTEDGLKRLPDILALDPRVVLLCLGGNDGLRQVPPEQMVQNLDQIITQLHAHGSFVVLMGVRSASVFDRFGPFFKDLAKRKQVLFVPDVLDGIFSHPQFMSDTIHPNSEGYRRIAEKVAEALGPVMSQLQP